MKIKVILIDRVKFSLGQDENLNIFERLRSGFNKNVHEGL